jgi:hypothetical protein
LFCVGASMVSDPRKLRFLLGREVYFHRLKNRDYRSPLSIA